MTTARCAKSEPGVQLQRRTLTGALAAVLGLVFVPFGRTAAKPAREQEAEHRRESAARLRYAVFGEYAEGRNKLMQPGFNRRVFQRIDSQAGQGIRLNGDGTITIAPGTYRINGFSMVTQQLGFSPPTFEHDNNYPGYAIVKPANSSDFGDAIAIGSLSTAGYSTPSIFDAIYSTDTEVVVEVGHQAGKALNAEVYLSVYEVDGVTSPYHLAARVCITRLDDNSVMS